MKDSARLLLTPLFVAGVLALPATSSPAADLTPEQIEAVRQQLAALRDTVEGRTSEKNRSAWSVFMAASQDPREAVELFENCTKIVDFDREGREESDFREWQKRQENLYSNDAFMESLMLQLRWLALTCKAAEAEDFATVLPEILTYLDGLTRLNEMPTGPALGSVGGSIFVRAYELERLVASNENWEPVPFNVSGIYERIILPYLRLEKPGQLMTAWDKRIAQQTQMVAFFKARQEDEVRGNSRERERKENEQRRQQNTRGVLKEHDEDDFARDTLPQLKWDRLRDQFIYVDETTAAQGMLAFLNENLTHRKAADWLTEMQTMISDSDSPGSAPAATTPAVSQSNPAPAAPASPARVTAESLGLE